MSQTKFYIVVFDDGDSVCTPYTITDDGGLELASSHEDVAGFPTRAAAGRAIRISAAKAKYDAARGAIVNTDFVGTSLRNIKIRRVVVGGAT